MPAGRHRKPVSTRTRLRRLGLLALPVVAVLGAVPVLGPVGPTADPDPAPGSAVAVGQRRPVPAQRRAPATAASRSLVRPEPPVPRLADVTELAARFAPAAGEPASRWTAAPLNVWTRASERSRRLTVLGAGERVRVTGRVQGPWTQVLGKGRPGWVRTAYLRRAKPHQSDLQLTSVPAAVSGRSCPDGSGVESGLTANAVAVYRAVCAAFPAVTSWGGSSGRSGDHGSGRALDIMASPTLGQAIAAYARANAARLGVSQVLWSRTIWTVQRRSEGWRPMPDRGSPTANHEDHVHVTVY